MSKVKKLIILLVLSLFSINPSFAEDDNKFVPGISDLPVPANFHLKHDSTSIFHNQEGRIIDATFIGASTEPEIEQFYNLTLRALGWKRVKRFIYTRESETLKISTRTVSDKQLNNLEITFSLGPQ